MVGSMLKKWTDRRTEPILEDPSVGSKIQEIFITHLEQHPWWKGRFHLQVI
jgi:hypothetical protein